MAAHLEGEGSSRQLGLVAAAVETTEYQWTPEWWVGWGAPVAVAGLVA